MQEHVHLGDGVGGGVEFLAVQVRRTARFVRVALVVVEPALDEQPARAAGRVVDGGVRRRVEQLGHQPAHFLRGVELAGALPLALGELAQQVLVGAAQDVGLRVVQPQAVAVQHLDERDQPVVVEDALAALALVVVLDVQGAVQVGVEAHRLAKRIGDELAQPAVRAMMAHRPPVVRLGDVEADDGLAAGRQRVGMVGLDDGARHLFAAVLRHIRGELVIEDIGQALEEDQGQDEVLELRRVGRAPDFARGVPEPLLQGGDVEMFLGVGAQGECGLRKGVRSNARACGSGRLWQCSLLEGFAAVGSVSR